MGNPAGVRRDFDALEKRRFRAIRLYERGENQSAIARQVKVVRQTVARWVQQYRAQGKSGLRKAGRAGRKPRLSGQHWRRLHTLLLQGPERLGYETPLWTCPRVAHLIEQEFGVRYHEGHVWKILVGLGWSPQRPVGRARERNEEQIQHWKKKVWPAIKKSAPRRAHSSLPRRKRPEPATPSLSHLGAARTNPRPAVQLQLEESVRGRRAHAVELLLSSVSRFHQEGAGTGLSSSLGTTSALAVVAGVGPFAGASQSAGPRLHRWPAGLDSPRVPSALCSGTEPSVIHLGSLEAARTAECLSPGLLPTQ